MKSSIHPQNYRPVVFSDEQVEGFAFLQLSQQRKQPELSNGKTSRNIHWFGFHISSASHPFFTGEEKIIDTEGRVDRFKARQAAAEARRAALANKAKKANAKKAAKTDSPKSDKKTK
ncbi:50S ribosomal protein L31 [Candidatus Minimicrobia naudis]|uniref:50S ribosomal protein L31 n=1 Tax=Candidatus Minimicrobia naudis TaxID=2841263 RepID=A0A8F1MCB3_9BACT|nr:50S ribosomal protein L31 [Candidatus Minimicrobia naudis]